MAALASPLRAFPASVTAASSSLRARAAKPRGGRAASSSRVAVALSFATTDEASARARTAPAGLGSTFTTWLLKEEIGGRVDGELAIVLSSVALACKQIASRVQRAPVAGDTGLAGDVNVQGEDQVCRRAKAKLLSFASFRARVARVNARASLSNTVL